MRVGVGLRPVGGFLLSAAVVLTGLGGANPARAQALEHAPAAPPAKPAVPAEPPGPSRVLATERSVPPGLARLGPGGLPPEILPPDSGYGPAAHEPQGPP